MPGRQCGWAAIVLGLFGLMGGGAGIAGESGAVRGPVWWNHASPVHPALWPEPEPLPRFEPPAPPAAPTVFVAWCARASSATERAICASDRLRQLDNEMTAVYGRSNWTGKGASQRQWLAERDHCGAATGCIERSYVDRIAFIRRQASSPPPPTGSQPSWCRSGAALNATESAICRSSFLGGLDRDMSAIYSRARARGVDWGQREWLAQRNRCGGNESCIGNAYRQRIAELRSRL